MKFKRTCNNCADQMVCIAYGKETNEVCTDWTLSYNEFEKLIKDKTINEYEEILKKYLK